jgi:1-acyl-sn-glycerol-3-phosphate acyltransferase
MRPPNAVIRRALIDPAWVPVAVILTVLLLAAGLAGTLAVPLSRRRRPLRLALFGAFYLILDACLVVCCAAMWLRHPLPRRRDQPRWSAAHLRLLRRALSLLIAVAGRLLGFVVEVEEPPNAAAIAGRPLLVMARHGGPGDSFALADLLVTRYQRRPAIVLTERLRWDPGLDVILSRLPSCFIRRGEGRSAPERLAELARSLEPDDAILLFPEGGNWTPSRYLRAISRLRRSGPQQAAADAAENPNVLPPHPAGLLACLKSRPDLDVAVVAHTGLEDLVSPGLLWRALPVSDQPMVVRWWHEPAAAMPDSDTGRRDWLRLQWAIVDSWIAYRKAARIPASPASTASPARPASTVSTVSPASTAAGKPAPLPSTRPTTDG